VDCCLQDAVAYHASFLFDYILDYPEHKPALLRLNAFSRGRLKLLWEHFENSLNDRLLHVGVDSVDTVAFLALSLEPIRVVDSTGYLMDRLFHAVQKYIAGRPDGLSAVMQMILSLMADPVYQGILSSQAPFSFDSDEGANMFRQLPMNWVPDPLEALHLARAIPMSVKVGTIFDILANCFASPDDFVKTYQSLLFTSLMRLTDVNCLSHTLAEMELLRSKVMSIIWVACDIMVSDAKVSLKACVNPVVQPLIISHCYWPLRLPHARDYENDQQLLPHADIIRSLLGSFSSRFPHRYLRWHRSLDTFDVAIDFSNGRFEFRAISYSQKLVLDLLHSAVANTMHLKFFSEDLLGSVQFWLRKRVILLEDSDQVLRLANHYDPTLAEYCNVHLSTLTSSLPIPSSIGTTAKANDQPFERYWGNITAMLTNFGPMRLDRIHMTLGMWAGDEYKGTKELLETYLQAKICSNQLLFNAEQRTFELMHSISRQK
jgi:hypothetical protein